MPREIAFREKGSRGRSYSRSRGRPCNRSRAPTQEDHLPARRTVRCSQHSHDRQHHYRSISWRGSSSRGSSRNPIGSRLGGRRIRENFAHFCRSEVTQMSGTIVEGMGIVQHLSKKDTTQLKLSEKYVENPEQNKYLEDMILSEKASGGLVATDALLWLRRALQFITVFFEMILDDTRKDTVTEDLTTFVKRAYSETLERHHGWLGTQLFNVLSRFVPSRQTLLYRLALDEYNQNHCVLKDMDTFFKNMTACVYRLIEFYEEEGLETDTRV